MGESASLDSTDGEIRQQRAAIEQTRDEMAFTIDALQERLDPKLISGRVKDAVRDQTIGRGERLVDEVQARARVTSNGLIGSIRSNPLPALAAVAGLGWFYLRRPTAVSIDGDIHTRNYQREMSMGGSTSRVSTGISTTGGSMHHVGDHGPGIVNETTDRVSGVASQATERVSDIASQTSGRVSDMASQTTERVSDIASQTTGRVSDLAGQATDRVTGMASQTTERVGEIAGTVSHMASSVPHKASELAGTVGSSARNVGSTVKEKVTSRNWIEDAPLAIGVAALGLGAAVGLAAPRSRREAEMLGDARETVIQRTQEMVHDVTEQARGRIQNVTRQVQDVAGEVQGIVKEEVEKTGIRVPSSDDRSSTGETPVQARPSVTETPTSMPISMRDSGLPIPDNGVRDSGIPIRERKVS
jgi:hypothetical protein